MATEGVVHWVPKVASLVFERDGMLFSAAAGPLGGDQRRDAACLAASKQESRMRSTLAGDRPATRPDYLGFPAAGRCVPDLPLPGAALGIRPGDEYCAATNIPARGANTAGGFPT